VVGDKKQFLRDLFVGEFGGHAFVIDVAGPVPGEFPRGPVAKRVDIASRKFEHELLLEREIPDDRVPCLHIWSGTEIFAAAFGSPVHYPDDNMPFALPAVHDAGEADALEEPDIFTGPLGEMFAIGDSLVDRFGNEYPVRICDVQSPLDIAALIWEKQSFYMALIDAPAVVHGLLQKITNTLIRFIREFKSRYPNHNLAHYPNYWLPSGLGMALSEDEVGCISPAQFAEFSLPYLNVLSREFGGLSVHCCAESVHQWDQFLKIEKLYSLNLVRGFQEQVDSIPRFSGKTVLMPQGFETESTIQDSIRKLLLHAREDTRFHFFCGAPDIDTAKRLADELRFICGRD